ncbi:uncharacterized protein isoform X2 [Leptinotarsa decemlineata]|uniref:uncharacterized protein isoform X2 n=1 Tax=Leptinotarsa decemlineata TaxID=7539 RepID=UPI003D308E0B
MRVLLSTDHYLFCWKSKHFKDKYFKPFSTLHIICTTAMSSTLVYVVLALTVFFILCPGTIAGLWICKPCENQAECDSQPKEYCVWGEVRDACNRRACAKGPGERCGGSLNILGQCGEGMMCKSDEKCHGCSLQTMQCYNE